MAANVILERRMRQFSHVLEEACHSETPRMLSFLLVSL